MNNNIFNVHKINMYSFGLCCLTAALFEDLTKYNTLDYFYKI